MEWEIHSSQQAMHEWREQGVRHDPVTDRYYPRPSLTYHFRGPAGRAYGHLRSIDMDCPLVHPAAMERQCELLQDHLLRNLEEIVQQQGAAVTPAMRRKVAGAVAEYRGRHWIRLMKWKWRRWLRSWFGRRPAAPPAEYPVDDFGADAAD